VHDCIPLVDATGSRFLSRAQVILLGSCDKIKTLLISYHLGTMQLLQERIEGKCQRRHKPRLLLRPANHRLVHAKIRDLRRGMPCSARSQFISLNKNNVAPTLLGQVIKRRAAGDAASDNNDPRSCFHERSL
jgi:hypothetical protein